MNVLAKRFTLLWTATLVAVFAAQTWAQSKPATKPVLAVFNLDGPVLEQPMGDDFPFGAVGAESLKDLIARMKKARDDAAVKGIVLLLGAADIGHAQTEEVRDIMDQLKKAGKQIHVHVDSLATADYVLLSGASRISVVPTGDIWLTGLYGEAMYLRGLLDKLGIVPDYLTCGEYKSAAEMFMRTNPSPEAEKMQNWLLDSLYDTYVELIAKGRNVTPAKAKEWIDGGPYTAANAKQAGIIDAVEHRARFVAELKRQYGADVQLDKKYGKRKPMELDFSNPFAMLQLWATLLQGPKKPAKGKDALAIVYVEGPILPGDDGGGLFPGGAAFSEPIRKALEETARDDSIKGVVLRVDSPGGSAVASEIILNASKTVRAKKPLVVSMGNVAGSGGYYVACGADTIFADATTITASIGVVGGKFATTTMWNKLGINWKSYQRGANAGLLSSENVFSDAERQKIQSWMDEIYEVFKGHVIAVRGKRLKKPIDELAGGRVFTGKQALELGLVDRLGGLDDAIAYAAEQAKLKDYDVRVVPRPKNFLEMLVADLADDSDGSPTLQSLVRRLGASRARLFDAALPLVGDLDPHRLRAVRQALGRLELIQRERAVLMMPEILVRN
jgi:protease-4